MMTHRQVATLACRVLAIWAFIDALKLGHQPIQAIVALVRLGWRGVQVDYHWATAFTLIPIVMQIIIAIWLWKRAAIVATWMTGESLQDDLDEPEVVRRQAKIHEVQAVVLSSLGVWVLLEVVPNACSTIFEFLLAYLIAGGTQMAFDRASHVISGSLWIWCFQLLLGLWLVFGAKGITRLLRRARGDRPEPSNDLHNAAGRS